MLEAHLTLSGDFDMQIIKEMLGGKTHIDILSEKGVTIEKGRYKGELSKHSLINVYPPKGYNLEKQMGYLTKKASNIHYYGVKIEFNVLYEYKDQCNLSFDAEFMKKLAKNNIPLLVSCWKKQGKLRIG